MGYIFESDQAKARRNEQKHGVAFEETSTAFGDPLGFLMPDPDHSREEERFVTPGMSARRRPLEVAFVVRPRRTRLISARKATRREQIRYKEED